MTTTEQFDIVSFIDDNPLVNMDTSYQSRLINKIKDKFNTDEQKIFIGSFYTYLNYDSKKDFVIINQNQIINSKILSRNLLYKIMLNFDYNF